MGLAEVHVQPMAEWRMEIMEISTDKVVYLAQHLNVVTL
jgi:hypothetical protein